MSIGFKLRQIKANLIYRLRLASYWYEYFLWLLFGKKEIPPKKIKNVLVMSYGALGDNFVVIRVVNSLVESNKDVNFFVLMNNNGKRDMKWIEKFSKIKIIEDKEFESKKFDVTLLFNVEDKYLNRKNLGYVVGNEYHSIKSSIKGHRFLFLNNKISPRNKHKVEQEINISKIGCLKFNGLKKIKLNRDYKIEEYFKNKGIKKYVVLHPSGRNFSNILRQGKTPRLAWPLERFSKISDYLIEKENLDIVITGSKDEEKIGKKIIEMSKNKKRIHNFAGRFNIKGLTYIVQNSKLVLSIDTSVVHVAELTETPVIALFGPTFIEEVGAYGSRNQINLGHPEKCIRDRKKDICNLKENRCMDSISVNEVIEAINKIKSI